MKTWIYYIIGVLVCAFTISSCSLDETDYTEVEKGKYLNNADEAETVLLGVYRNLVEEGMYRYHLSLLFTLPSDIAKVEGNSINASYRAMANFSYTSTQSEVQTTWQSLYNAIYDANDFIESLSSKMENYSETDKKRATYYMAEARGLRALFYFELVRWFGHVALITTTGQSKQHPSTFKQAAPEDVYKFIEGDLKYAIETLPYASDDNIRSDKDFRLSKGSVLGLLTKVYATWAGYPVHDTSKWQNAAETAKVLVESGKHELLSDYEQLWKNTCNGVWNPTESLIEVSFYSPSITGVNANDPSGRIGKWNGVSASGIRGIRNSALWRVMPTFLKNWQDRAIDKRYALSVADYKYGFDKTTNQDGVKLPLSDKATLEEALADDSKDDIKKAYIGNITPAKWDTEKYVDASNYLIDSNVSNINWYILRYADVLLLYAEALNEWKQGPTTEAYTALNMVRRRGYGLDVNTAGSVCDLKDLDYAGFRQAVRDERAHELAFEGHRRQDLIRWGIYYESIKQTAQSLVNWYSDGAQYYQCAQYIQKNKNELMPIPQRDMDLMTSFTQNQGW